MYVIVNEDYRYFKGLDKKGCLVYHDITEAIIFDELDLAKNMLTVIDKIESDTFEIMEIILKPIEEEE